MDPIIARIISSYANYCKFFKKKQVCKATAMCVYSGEN